MRDLITRESRFPIRPASMYLPLDESEVRYRVPLNTSFDSVIISWKSRSLQLYLIGRQNHR